jgi:predicted ATPase
MRRDLTSSLKVAEELLQVAQQLDDLSLRLHAHHELANTLLWMGDHTKTQIQLDQAIALYNQSSPHLLASIYAEGDTWVLCLAQRALVLWLMGFPDQAMHTSQSVLGQLHKVGHAYNQVVIVNWMSYLHHYHRDAASVQTQAETALALALEHGVGHRAIQARMMQGWAWCVQGAIEEGLIEIQEGLTAWRASESTPLITYFLTLLAEAYQQAGRIPKGLMVLQEALRQSQSSGECFWQAEIHRLEGALRLRQDISEMSQAEHCFYQALAVARSQQAKSLELRAATSLARLWQSQRKRDEARELLEPVYSWFTEGFDTTDLIDAKTLLDELV